MNREETHGRIPVAKAASRRPLLGVGATRLWWLTAICAIVAVGLFFFSVDRSPKVTVHFDDGHGIKPGDALKYRGVTIGEIASVKLSDDLGSVAVRISLDPDSVGVARDQSQFWVQRPQFSLSRVSGLETVVGANYVGVVPGPADGPAKYEFEGLDAPPSLIDRAPLTIRIQFREGNGVAPGDALKHRGIQVGEVQTVSLDETMQSVSVTVRLVSSAAQLARQGTRFWVERPEISLQGIRGLETVVGGRYLAVQPGPTDAPPQVSFAGLERAPPIAERSEAGLEVILESTRRMGLSPGAPLKYRGIEVGSITAVGLSSDASQVEARAYVAAEYRTLICQRTEFWADSGLELNLGPLSGLELGFDSLSTLARGGVALAVPENAGSTVNTGFRFKLRDEAPDRWRQWQPSITLGNKALPDGTSVPEPIRISTEWSQRSMGFLRRRQTAFWGLHINGNRILSIRELLCPADEANLAVAGQQFKIGRQDVHGGGKLGVVKLTLPADVADKSTSSSQLRIPKDREDILIFGDPLSDPVPVSAGRLKKIERSRWEIDATIAFDTDWIGSAAVSRADGAVVGLLAVENANGMINLLNDSLIAGIEQQ